VKFDVNGNTVDAGAACGSGGGGLPSGTGVVNVTAGTGGLVTGSSTNCVLVSGGSAACGGATTDTGASIYSTTNQTVNNTTVTVVNVGNTQYDHGGFTGTANTLTVPAGDHGIYQFSAVVEFTSSGYTSNITLIIPLVNGGSPFGTFAGACLNRNDSNTYQPVFNASCQIYLNDGDAVTLAVYESSGSSVTVNPAYLQLVRIN
jgi:hypothetical protein